MLDGARRTVDGGRWTVDGGRCELVCASHGALLDGQTTGGYTHHVTHHITLIDHLITSVP